MKRARSFLLLLLGLSAVLCSFTAWTVYRERRQERLDRDLIAAAKRNDTKAVILLLKYGADMKPNACGYAPLVYAESFFIDSTDVLSDMLQRGADVNQREGSGNMATALWNAVAGLRVASVRLLLSYHADVTLRGTIESFTGNKVQQSTPLAMAKSIGDSAQTRQIIRLLQQAGAKE